MTRAKHNLTIHLNGNYLDNIQAKNLIRIENRESYLPPTEIAMQGSFKDIWLDYFINKQHLISQLTSGDQLIVNNDECKNKNGESVLKFSKHFLTIVETQKSRGYHLKGAKVNFIIYWKKEDTEREIKEYFT